MKKVLCVLLVALCVLGCLPVVVNAEESGELTFGNYTYEMYTKNSVIITDYSPTHEDTIKIPATINGYPVVALGEGSMKRMFEQHVILPDTMEIIEDNVFETCELKSIYIPKSVKSIGVISVEETIKVHKDNPYYKVVGGVLFSKDGKTLVDYPRMTNIDFPFYAEGETYNVPKGVEYIAKGAFQDAQYLRYVNLPEGLKGIEAEAFKGCGNLLEANWPKSLKYVMDGAYKDCDDLNGLYCYDTFDYIAPDAFEGTKWFERLPYGSTYIGSLLYTYKDDHIVPSLEVIKDGTTRIGANAFRGFGPNTLYIPATVVSIDLSAFYDDWNMMEIVVDENNPYFASVNGMLFDKEKKTLLAIPGGREDMKIEVPQGTEVIYPNAGYGCDYVHKLIIPDSVKYVGDSAFESCGWLTEVEFKGNVDYLGDRIFAGDLSMEKISLPGGKISFVGRDIFEGCEKLNEVNIPEGCVAYGSKDFVDTPWYNINSEIVMVNNNVVGHNYFSGKLQELVIPDGAVAIGREAFAGHSKLSKAYIPDTVTMIGDFAFANDPMLKEVYISATVDEIGRGAFGFMVTFDEETGEATSFEKVEGFVIKGYTNSLAESYADANGFEFISVGYMEPESTLLGDIDCDGKLTVRDATALQKYVAGMVGLNTQDKINADFNEDGKINVRDATAIQKRIAKIS